MINFHLYLTKISSVFNVFFKYGILLFDTANKRFFCNFYCVAFNFLTPFRNPPLSLYKSHSELLWEAHFCLQKCIKHFDNLLIYCFCMHFQNSFFHYFLYTLIVIVYWKNPLKCKKNCVLWFCFVLLCVKLSEVSCISGWNRVEVCVLGIPNCILTYSRNLNPTIQIPQSIIHRVSSL